jgi:ferric-dicitrate binding protein FerR (iron transport regulator)
MDQEEFIKKWIEGSLNEDEKKAFEKTDTFQVIRKLSDSLPAFKAPEFMVEKEWEKLQTKRSLKGKTVQLNWIKPFFRVAAVFIILIGIYFLFIHKSYTTFQTTTAENREFMLPDSSIVIMNALSRISYHDKSWFKEREVILKGEAYFKVSSGSRFDVKTDAGIVTVLGTHFNVKSRTDYFEVICYEGLVQVESHGESIELPANHMFRILKGEITSVSDISRKSPSWIENESSFRSVPLDEVLREFERQYNITVTTVNVDLDQLYTGGFVNNDISKALQSITIPLNLEYQNIRNQKIVLSAKSD